MESVEMNMEMVNVIANSFTAIIIEGTTVMTGNDLKYYLRQFNGWKFVKDSSIQTDINAIKELWDEFYNANKHNLLKMLEVNYEDYKPLENYRRVETITEQTNNQYGELNTSATSGARSTTNNMGKRETIGDNTHKVNAYNTTTYQNDNQDTYNNEEKAYTDTINQAAATDTTTVNSHNDTINRNINNLMYGNIGVTTSQQMADSEYQLRKFSVIKWLVNQFAFENLYLS